jgi:hypothetical protein
MVYIYYFKSDIINMAKVLWVLAHYQQQEANREMIIYYTKWTMIICSGSLQRRGWRMGAIKGGGCI